MRSFEDLLRSLPNCRARVSLLSPHRDHQTLSLLEVIVTVALCSPSEDLTKENASENVPRVVRVRRKDPVAVSWLETDSMTDGVVRKAV